MNYICVKKILSGMLGLCLIASIYIQTPAAPLDKALQRRAPVQAVPQTIRGIENAATLNTFFDSLAAIKERRRREPVRIVQYGDSHTAADLMTGAVRKSFQRDFNDDPNSPGVILEARGVNGARAVRLTSWSDSALSLNVAQRRPDLIILAYGTNEVTDNNWSVESYARMFSDIMRRFRRAAPQAAFLIIAPFDRAVRGPHGWQSVSRMTALIEAQRRAAIESGAAFWSGYGAMGGAGAMNSWVAQGLGQPDHVHLTAAGYIRMGGMLYTDLMDAYDAYTESLTQGKVDSLRVVGQAYGNLDAHEEQAVELFQ
jgi:lysophospholipase L1-like esterase